MIIILLILIGILSTVIGIFVLGCIIMHKIHKTTVYVRRRFKTPNMIKIKYYY